MYRSATRNTLFFIFLWLFISPASAQDHLDSLFSAIGQRLGYMNEVALYKLQNQIPVEDLEREGVVLENVKLRASSAGLNAETVEKLFTIQMDVAKAIQSRFIASDDSNISEREAVDLNSRIRPALSALTGQIIGSLGGQLSKSGPITEDLRIRFHNAIEANFLTEKEKDAIFDSLLGVRAE